VEQPFVIERVSVPPSERRDEQLGTKAKFWFRRGGSLVLFKRGRANEDWSEKAAAECAEFLGLPHASVELAECDGQPGIVSPSFVEEVDTLVHGNELLLSIDPLYPRERGYHVAQHTLDSIFEAFEVNRVSAPPSHAWPDGFDARDIFTGYLLLDGWIGNSDRHHENWAVVRRGAEQFLAPTYDHASAMGRNETVARLERRLAGDDPRVTVRTYAEKCRSAIYRSTAESHPMSAYDAFLEASRRRPIAGTFWRRKLASVDEGRIEGLFDRFPTDRITPGFKTFAIEILRYNRSRLLSSH
jgi:hypothetical protein